jgi:hypothetical protein
VAGGGALDLGKPLADRGGHVVDEAAGGVLLLQGDFEVYSPLPDLPISGENPKALAWEAATLRRRLLLGGVALRLQVSGRVRRQ